MKKLTFLTSIFFLLIFQVSHAFAEKVEITLVDQLNGVLNGYCFDIVGGNQNIDITKGLHTHTCYSYRGELGKDQIFESTRFSENTLYMPNYEVCATLSSLNIGATLGLKKCNAGKLQSISFSDSGKISPTSAPNLCLTAGEETRFGLRGKSPHQLKTLTLEACSDDKSAYQTWRTRTYDDDPV
ncbi:hypothetical protein ABFY09_14705 [Marinomonas sp. 5E14-1]|uniref:hypothetical protein n=1 Tax=Marinomonas sp. 5E14-1 TaxID=3153922 RepID=UPI00326695FE